jgi:hypothetical protein
MAPDGNAHGIKKAIWGVFLIALGVLFLLERMGVAGFRDIGAWWPLILVVVGITSLVQGRVGSALTMILLGGWFLAVTNDWDGLTYANSWPLVLVAVGMGIVVKALTGEDRRHHHGEEWRHRHPEGGPS